jgi:hypothetical protein
MCVTTFRNLGKGLQIVHPRTEILKKKKKCIFFGLYLNRKTSSFVQSNNFHSRVNVARENYAYQSCKVAYS